RRRFQAFLEDVVEGKTDLAAALDASGETGGAGESALTLSWSDDAHPTASRLPSEGRDRRGLLYGLSHRISEAGYGIEMAYIETPGERVRDEFYLSGPAGKVPAGGEGTRRRPPPAAERGGGSARASLCPRGFAPSRTAPSSFVSARTRTNSSPP